MIDIFQIYTEWSKSNNQSIQTESQEPEHYTVLPDTSTASFLSGSPSSERSHHSCRWSSQSPPAKWQEAWLYDSRPREAYLISWRPIDRDLAYMYDFTSSIRDAFKATQTPSARTKPTTRLWIIHSTSQVVRNERLQMTMRHRRHSRRTASLGGLQATVQFDSAEQLNTDTRNDSTGRELRPVIWCNRAENWNSRFPREVSFTQRLVNWVTFQRWSSRLTVSLYSVVWFWKVSSVDLPRLSK